MAARKHYRKITVSGEVYSYYVGRRFVDIRSDTEDSFRNTVSIANLLGLSEEEVERGQWKRWLSVKPRNIADYIRGLKCTIPAQ